MTNRKLFQIFAAALLLASLFAAGCEKSSEASKAGNTPPPPLVKTAVVSRSDVPLVREYVGQTAGSREVQVRARVGGILLRRAYREGAWVQEGDVLFEIDPEPYRAALAQAEGELERQKANLVNARLERDRISALFAESAVSAQERDNAVTNYEATRAAVHAAEAKVREARINLGYTKVRAPISGITSQETRSEGSLVTLDQAGSLLTTISQLDPLYVNFSVPGTEALRLRRLQAEGSLVLPEGGYRLRLKLADGSMFENVGHINFSDRQVDPGTGAIRVRGEFSNTQGLVLPGEFVRVLVEGGVLKDTVVVPQRAVLFTSNSPIVYVLDENMVASPRPVELGDTAGDGFIVKKGLKAGERIVSEGIIKVRPGAPVNPMPEKPAAGGDA